MSGATKMEFWIKWMEANEVDKLKLIRSLPVDNKYASLLNSYLVDLYETIQCIGVFRDAMCNTLEIWEMDNVLTLRIFGDKGRYNEFLFFKSDKSRSSSTCLYVQKTLCNLEEGDRKP